MKRSVQRVFARELTKGDFLEAKMQTLSVCFELPAGDRDEGSRHLDLNAMLMQNIYTLLPLSFSLRVHGFYVF